MKKYLIVILFAVLLLVNMDKALAIHQYTVKFKVDGKAISTQKVVSGEDATPPADPGVEGKKFSGWSGDYKNIQKNTIINAMFSGEGITTKSKDSKDSSSTSIADAQNNSSQSPAEALNAANNSSNVKYNSTERESELESDPSLSTNNMERTIEEVEEGKQVETEPDGERSTTEEDKKPVKNNYTGQKKTNGSTTEVKKDELPVESKDDKSIVKLGIYAGVILITLGLVLLIIIKV